MATFVLVSGAWHAGWCWERVVPLLEAAGHRALAPDLLAMGGDTTPIADVTLALWADQIAGLITAQPEPVILVGHSRGGIVISEAAERVPDRIACLVYLTALLIPSGESSMTTAMRGMTGLVGEMFVPAPEGGMTVRPELVGPTFYNTTEPAWVERATAMLTPEPMTTSATPLQLTAERYGRVPRAFIECAEDRALTLELQREMQASLPCDPVFTLATDHSPFYSDPQALVDCLQSIAAGAMSPA
jgi:pimeloyl-ACP methyl ester carboxylesterase